MGKSFTVDWDSRVYTFTGVMFAGTCVRVCVSALPADLSGRCGQALLILTACFIF